MRPPCPALPCAALRCCVLRRSQAVCGNLCFSNMECQAFGYGIYRSFLSNNVKDCILFKALPTYHLHGVAPLRALSCQAPWGSNASAACSAVPLHMGLCNVSGGSSATDDVSTCTARSGSGAVVCNTTTTGSSGNCSYTPDASAACSAAGCVFANT